MRRAIIIKSRTLVLALVSLFVTMAASAQPAVDNRIYKKWIVVDEDGSRTIFDLSDKKHWIATTNAVTETGAEGQAVAEDAPMRQTASLEIRAHRGGHSYGTIDMKSADGSWAEYCTYEDLTNNSVTFMFDGEIVWHAVVYNEP